MERIATGHEARLYGLREYRPWTRPPHIRVTGTRIVEEGLAAGNGVILWVAPFVYASLITKIAFHEAGFGVSHLSRPTHGFGGSPFAVRWLNPIWTRIEERYLRGRIVMAGPVDIGALRAVRARLAESHVVSITFGDEGVRVVTVDLLGGDLRVATGPITLAQRTRAWLLPVFTVRTESGRFEVEIQTPLELPRPETDPRDVHRRVAEQYARRLTPFVKAYPGQWLG